MSVTNFVKIGLKMFFRKGTLGLPEIELFVMRANIKLVAVDEQQAYTAGPPRRPFTMATAWPTLWPNYVTNRCSTKPTTFPKST